MFRGELGKTYQDGEIIIRQGDHGDSMYVVLEGQVEVIHDLEQETRRLAVLGDGEFFGEMELFNPAARNATVRALGDARVLTVDKKLLLRRIKEDPTLAFRFLEKLSGRLRETNLSLELLLR